MSAKGRTTFLIVAAALVLTACGDKSDKSTGSRAAQFKKPPAPAATQAPAPAPDKPSAPRKPTVPPAPPALVEVLVDLGKWDAASPDNRRAAAREVVKRTPGFELLRMEEFSCGGQKHEVAVLRHAKSDLEFVLVPAGTFDMGSPETEKGREVFENLHSVTLTKPFLLARTECTQAAWSRVMATDPSKFKGADRPVESVSWEDANSFCEAAGLQLPTEAQWERACRAGTSARFFHGDDVESLEEYAWFAPAPVELPGGAKNTADAPQETHPVGQKKPNAFGLLDMLGNVHEWCADMMSPYPTAAVKDPFQPIDGSHVDPIFRGGCWRLRDVASRSAYRLSLSAKSRDATIGFRPAKTVSLE